MEVEPQSSAKDTPETVAGTKAPTRKRLKSDVNKPGSFSPLKKRKSSTKDRRIQDSLNNYHKDEKF